jgi:endonuclease/exonuclease/phosphatase (EEP) superfamily protein YafD
MIRRVLTALFLVVISIGLALAAWPQLFNLAHSPVLAQVVSLRGASVAVAAVGVGVALVIAATSRKSRRFAASVALIFAVYGGFNALIIADRGLGDTEFATPSPSDITVLSWNTLGDAPGAEAVAAIAIDEGAEVIALPETTAAFGDDVAARLTAAGSPTRVLTVAFDQISKARSTTLLVSERLGEYAIDETVGNTGQVPSIVARPVSGEGPTLIAVHPVAPVPNELETWSNDLEWLSSVCIGDDVIMAGDFNSTIDHYTDIEHAEGATIGDCIDAGMASGNAGVGTWPASLPAIIGAPIDHVMATKNWAVTGMRVIESRDQAGSDHRPVVAQLSVAGN